MSPEAELRDWLTATLAEIYDLEDDVRDYHPDMPTWPDSAQRAWLRHHGLHNGKPR